ncbi:MAG TPA: DUF4395 domain-containing protein [Ignavibacteriaceae bacterium]|nr:DUF4395 domain-containing protein [Ignavibacteriaceae bacterium]
MSKVIKFGEEAEGYSIPVLNEREVRASAGIFFLMMFASIMIVLLKQDFLWIKYVIIIFLTDFFIRVFVNPKYSPSLIIGRLIVGNQAPEYVDAAPKKFAWSIGISLAAVMFILMVLANSYSPITGLICLICLVFLFFESAFGICLGCMFYPLFYKKKIRHCPGEICNVKVKQDIQKTSKVQLLIVFGFAAFIFLTAFFFNNKLSNQPYYLFGGRSSEQVNK